MFGLELNELIAIAAILVVTLIYIIVKRKSAKTISKKEIKNIEVVEDEYDISFNNEVIKEKNLESDEEEVVEEEPQKELKTIELETKPEIIFDRKIQKDDFVDFSGMRILVAEDNIINQKVLLGLLKDSGMEIVVADDGQEALEVLENDQNFALVLMDAHMPRVDGFEATRKIRENSKYDHIPVVALSGDTASDDVRKMKEVGMQEHLEKPIQLNKLYYILDLYFKPSQLEEEIKENKVENSGEYAKDSISDVKLVDFETGISISGDDFEFYNEILREFVEHYKDLANSIMYMWDEGQFADADRLLLDMVGISANIGATGLNRVAQELKHTLKSKDQDKIKESILEFQKTLSLTIQEIEKFQS